GGHRRDRDVWQERFAAIEGRCEVLSPATPRRVVPPVVPGDSDDSILINCHDRRHAEVGRHAFSRWAVVVDLFRLGPCMPLVGRHPHPDVGVSSCYVVPDHVQLITKLARWRRVGRENWERERAAKIAPKMTPSRRPDLAYLLRLFECFAAVGRPQTVDRLTIVLAPAERKEILIVGKKQRAVGKDERLSDHELAVVVAAEQKRFAESLTAVVRVVQKYMKLPL